MTGLQASACAKLMIDVKAKEMVTLETWTWTALKIRRQRQRSKKRRLYFAIIAVPVSTRPSSLLTGRRT